MCSLICQPFQGAILTNNREDHYYVIHNMDKLDMHRVPSVSI